MNIPRAPQSFAPIKRTKEQKATVLRKLDEAVLRGQREKRAAEREAEAWIATVRARKAKP